MRFFDTLGSRLILTFSLILLLAMGTALVLGSWLALGSARVQLKEDIESETAILQQLLAAPLWNLDGSHLATIGKIYSQRDSVVGLQILTETGKAVFQFRRAQAEAVETRSAGITMDGLDIGSFELAMGLAEVERSNLRLESAIFGVFSLIFLLALMVGSLVSRHLLARPFREIEARLADYQPGSGGLASIKVKYREFRPLLDRLTQLSDLVEEQLGRLQDEENRLKLIIEMSPIALALTRLDGHIDKLNSHFTSLFGYTTDDFDHVRDWFPLAYPDPAYRAKLIAEWERRVGNYLRGDGPYEVQEAEVRCKDGTTKLISFNYAAVNGFGITSFFDLTEVRQRENTLKQLNKELESKSREMERFTYSVSHDLKAPMVTIKGYSGYVEQALRSGQGLDRALFDLERISKAADKATELLQGLLELSRIGRQTNPVTCFDSRAVVEEVLAGFKPVLDPLGAKISFLGPWPEILGDQARISEIWQNYIENAIKYRSPDRTLSLLFETWSAEGLVCFSVTDNGIGVDSKHIEAIFGIFEKLNPKTEGSGIGLSIVRKIAEFHGGRAWAEAIHGGTRFCFSLSPSGPPQA